MIRQSECKKERSLKNGCHQSTMTPTYMATGKSLNTTTPKFELDLGQNISLHRQVLHSLHVF